MFWFVLRLAALGRRRGELSRHRSPPRSNSRLNVTRHKRIVKLFIKQTLNDYVNFCDSFSYWLAHHLATVKGRLRSSLRPWEGPRFSAQTRRPITGLLACLRTRPIAGYADSSSGLSRHLWTNDDSRQHYSKPQTTDERIQNELQKFERHLGMHA
jgi:hypothetical protein